MQPYDEFSMLADNAAEAELAWEGPPPVERLEVEGPAGLAVSAILRSPRHLEREIGSQ